jgi:DNA-binding transcriptional LysR family regulator
MVDVDELASLDCVLWQRTGKQAARALDCNQSTISRRLGRCLEVFDLKMRRIRNEWDTPLSALLQMERELHQHGRLLGHRPLRLEACPLTGPLLAHPLPQGWIGGVYDHIGVQRPMQLLRDRVIDAWICDAVDDLPPPAGRPDLAVHPLWRIPVALHAAPTHPLAHERGLTTDDLRSFPCLDIPAGSFERSRSLLHGLGLDHRPTKLVPYIQTDWEARAQDGFTLLCFTSLHRLASPDLVPLDAPEAFSNGGALVCHRDLADHPPIQMLLDTLKGRLAQTAAAITDLERL